MATRETSVQEAQNIPPSDSLPLPPQTGNVTLPQELARAWLVCGTHLFAMRSCEYTYIRNGEPKAQAIRGWFVIPDHSCIRGLQSRASICDQNKKIYGWGANLFHCRQPPILDDLCPKLFPRELLFVIITVHGALHHFFLQHPIPLSVDTMWVGTSILWDTMWVGTSILWDIFDSMSVTSTINLTALLCFCHLFYLQSTVEDYSNTGHCISWF